MKKGLTVYAWWGKRNGATKKMVLAAESKAVAARQIGYTGVWRMKSCVATDDELEKDAAFQRPGTVFCRDEYGFNKGDFEVCPISEITDKGD